MAGLVTQFCIANNNSMGSFCTYCGTVFSSTEMLHGNGEQRDRLPTPSSERKEQEKIPIVTAFNGARKFSSMQGQMSITCMRLFPKLWEKMMNSRKQMVDITRENLGFLSLLILRNQILSNSNSQQCTLCTRVSWL